MKTSFIFSIAFLFTIPLFSQFISKKSNVITFEGVEAKGPKIDQLTIASDNTLQDGVYITADSIVRIKGKLVASPAISRMTINGGDVPIGPDYAFSFQRALLINELLTIDIQVYDSEQNSSVYHYFFRRIKNEKRMALVIGNSSYSHSSRLKNPVNDAKLIGNTLRKLNFDVYENLDLSLDNLRKAIREFSLRSEEADVVLIYYAGHAFQVDDINYLIPIDAKCESKKTLPLETIRVDVLLDLLESNATNRVNIIILDACRNNPFRTWARGGDNGLAVMTAPGGTFLAYSTSPGATAADGSGVNSLYTEELAKQMLIPQTIEEVFKNTRVRVERESEREQIPWELSSLRGMYRLK